MYDAREPLYQHSLTLCGDGDEITVWNDGEEKLTTDIEGLKALAGQMQAGETPDWFVPGSTDWPVEMIGTVLLVVAARMEAETSCDDTLKRLYGGSTFGPANPDTRSAGLFIAEDRQTVNWAN
tara:strand:+ start:2264 stop:2632 length:369 start_codon:yes stop_codon:yes gene_type:complete